LTRTIDVTQIDQLREALAGRGVTMEYFETGAEALVRLKELVPLGTEVQTGSSTTLDQIGCTAWLTALHREGRLRYFRAETQQVSDEAVRTANRRQATLAEYFLGSVNALTEDGIAVAADAAGTRVGGYVFGARNVIWVVGVNKIVRTLDEAVRRVWEVALPGEDARVKSIGGHGSEVGKMVMFHHERPGRIRILLVGEELGF
jgi:hypothetical protein